MLGDLVRFFCIFTICVLSFGIYTYSYNNNNHIENSALPLCNHQRCNSIVSACLHAGSCKCALRNETCCSDCVRCLGAQYYEDCCSCLACANCPQGISELPHLKYVESYSEALTGEPALFEAFTSATGREWHTHTFALMPEQKESELERVLNPVGTRQGNCTVLYLDECTRWQQCREQCWSLGASGYRWFHDGCCECVGAKCLEYGLIESRCRSCPVANVELNGEVFKRAMGDKV